MDSQDQCSLVQENDQEMSKKKIIKAYILQISTVNNSALFQYLATLIIISLFGIVNQNIT